MKAVVYKTEEERLEALRKMVGLRKVWEARVHELTEAFHEAVDDYRAASAAFGVF